MAIIEAITFDFWDTIAIDDSDEPKRAQRGLPSKADERVALFVDHIARRYPDIDAEDAASAYRYAVEQFRHAWHDEHRTPGVRQRIYFAYEHLGLVPGPGQYARLLREIDELSRAIETMEVRIAPDFAPGVHWALQVLAQEYTLGIISDTIHTTGVGLRHLLAQQGLLHYFKFAIFSDEVRTSKPSAQVFRMASHQVGLPPMKMAHIGDRESNDIHGPLSIGMRAVLYTGVIDRGSQQTRANAVCRQYTDLPEIVRRLR